MISSDLIDGSIFKAIRDARKELGPIEKGAENPFFNSSYMSLDDILEAVNPVLDRNGLFLMHWPDQTSSGEPALTTVLVHENGEWIKSTAALSLAKKDPQAQGSAITYMKRYSLVAIFSIKGVEADDDGNLASQPDSKVTRQGKVADENNASTDVVRLRRELEAAAKAKGFSQAQLTKKYHDEFGKDYKQDTDEGNLAKALVKLA